MQARDIPLLSPQGTRIVGFLTTSGAACPVTCRYARLDGGHHVFYEVPFGRMGELAGGEGQRICIDERGARWKERDVTWASIPRDA